jgi:Family of unknown function (DUF6455)
VIVVIVLIAFTLTIAIKQNFNVSQQLRIKLMDKLKQLPFYKMLTRRDIDINEYLHDQQINDIEIQLKNCNECSPNKKCAEVLAKEDKPGIDYSFCPNDEYFKQSIKPDTKSNTDNNNE